MATQTITRLIDDLDESDADETVDFSLDGRDYEIDLTSDHADDLRDALRPYISAARRASGGSGVPTRRTKAERTDHSKRDEAVAIRAWVREHGGKVGDRGRIPGDLVEAYHKRDTSIFNGVAEGSGEVDDAVEEAQPAGVGAGVGDPFATFAEPQGPHF